MKGEDEVVTSVPPNTRPLFTRAIVDAEMPKFKPKFHMEMRKGNTQKLV